MPHRVMAEGRWKPAGPQGPSGAPWGPPPPPAGHPIISKIATSNLVDYNGVDQRCMLTSGQAVTEEFGVPAYHRTVMGDDVRELRSEVHQPEDLELFVQPEDGWYFAGWTQPTPVPSTPLPPACPCNGNGLSCVLEFEDIGRYTPDASSDVVHCIAEFDRIVRPGVNTGGTVPM